jgi:hypothetical protein
VIVKIALIDLGPPCPDHVAEPHREDGFGVSPRRLSEVRALRGDLRSFSSWFAGLLLSEDSEPNQNEGAGQCRDPNPDMKEEAEAKIERHPRHVEERRRSRT